MTRSALRQHRAEKLSNFGNASVASHDGAALSLKFSDAHQRWEHVPVQRGGKSSAQQHNGFGVRGWVLAREQTRCSVDLAALGEGTLQVEGLKWLGRLAKFWGVCY